MTSRGGNKDLVIDDEGVMNFRKSRDVIYGRPQRLTVNITREEVRQFFSEYST